MENLVTKNTKRIKCYNCNNYTILIKNNENSFSGRCEHCATHIHMKKHANTTFIKFTSK